MSLEVLLQTIISGLLLGGVYALIAGGLSLIYGVMVIINFAHGEFLMLGLYLSYWGYKIAGIDPYLSLPMVALSLFLFGVFVYRVVIKPALNAIMINQIMITLGLSTLLVGIAMLLWGAQPRNVMLPYSHEGFRFAGLIVNYPRFIALITSIFLTALLYFFLNRTKTGTAIRAVSQSRLAAQFMGIDVDKIYMLTLGIGAALTGIAGSLIINSYPITPTIGWNFSMSAFIIVVLGTMGNYLGAFIASMIIGVAESVGGLIFGNDVRQVISMGVFILVLLIKPEGLFGRKS